MKIRVRDTEGCEPDESFLWDSIMVNRPDASGGYADWIMAGPDDPPSQRGGLRSRMGLHTAILICLLTDRRLPEGVPSPRDDGDPRGWWGDSIRLEDEPDTEIGSLLWTLERGTLDEDVARLAKDYAEEALDVLIDQGAVGRFEVETEADKARGFLVIRVGAFDHAGARIYDERFNFLWRAELSRPAPMNFGTR